MRTTRLAVAVLALAAWTAGCGSGDGVPLTAGSTTTSSSTSSTVPSGAASTTTTVTNVTTTTAAGAEAGCSVRMHLADAVSVGALQWEVDYGAAAVEFAGEGAGVRCTNHVGGALAAYNDDDAGRTLSLGIISLSAVHGPTTLAECLVEAEGLFDHDELRVVTIDATDPDGQPIVPVPQVVLSSRCGFEPTTTSVTTTTLLTEPQDVVFRLEAAGATLGSLQFRVDYAGLPGAFDGTGQAARCTVLAPEVLWAANHDRRSKRLRVGLISLAGIEAPGDLVRCVFLASVEHPAEAADFEILVEDSSGLDSVPTTATVSVRLDDAAP